MSQNEMCLCVFLQARARLDLREKATKSDAEDVVEIMKHRWNYRSLISIVSIDLFTAVNHVKWVVLILVTYVQWFLYCENYASVVWLWWHLVTISASCLSCAVLASSVSSWDVKCVFLPLCVCVCVCVCVLFCCAVWLIRTQMVSAIWTLSALSLGQEWVSAALHNDWSMHCTLTPRGPIRCSLTCKRSDLWLREWT